MSAYEELLAGLREWTSTHDAPVHAAVELLIEHDSWLRRADFIRSCVRVEHGMTRIVWTTAGEMLKSAELTASSSALVVLDVAVLLAQDGLGLTRLDRTTRASVVRAVTDALAVRR